MSEIIKITCVCGQENELILKDGIYYRNEIRHGNGSDSKGLCFNCNKPLKILKQETATENKQPELNKTDDETSNQPKAKTKGKK